MGSSTFLGLVSHGLIHNAALLLAVAFVFDMVAIRWRTGQASFWQVFVGLALGIIGISVMLTPWTFVPGIVFDTRSVLLGLAGLFFGLVPTVIAVAMTAAFRFYEGGAGVLGGIVVILTSGTIGIAWRHLRRRPLSEISWRELYFFGVVIHVVMLAMIFTLPWETALGVLMMNRLRREQTEETLRKSKQVLSDTETISKVGGWAYDVGESWITWTDEVYRIYGVTKETYDPNKIQKGPKFYSKKDRHAIERALMSSIQTGETYHLNLRLNSADGTQKWVHTIGRPVLEEGKVVKVIGYIADITERKRAEEALVDTTERLRKWLAGTVQAISTVVETRDPYTAGHQRRTADLARAIAEEMGFAADRTDFIRIAASIHDIGKIAIPSEILSKPAKLTDIEFTLVKSHPQAGYDILKDIEFPWPVAEVVLQHHERMNGSGYPNGIKGEDILPEAKIIAVADVVEAIVSHRPYRSALGLAIAVEEILDNRGSLYDSEVVDACVKLFHEKGYQLP